MRLVTNPEPALRRTAPLPKEKTAVPPIGRYLWGGLATALVIGLAVLSMQAFPLGQGGNILLAATALGILLNLAGSIGLWAGATLLTVVAVNLSLGNQPLAERCADLAYYGVVTGTLWSLWNGLIDRLGWRLPVPALASWLAGSLGKRRRAVAEPATGEQPEALGGA